MMGQIQLPCGLYPINRLRLHDGQLEIIFEVPVNVWDPGDGYYKVFGDDGSLIAEGACLAEIAKPTPADKGKTLAFTLRWSVNDKMTDSARALAGRS